jgi:hypothetical protein
MQPGKSMIAIWRCSAVVLAIALSGSSIAVGQFAAPPSALDENVCKMP